MRVDSDVVRGIAKELAVGNHSDESVDSNDGASVAGTVENTSGLVDQTLDVLGSDLALVNDLVTNGDGVESGPVTVGGGGEDVELLREGRGLPDVVNTSEDLQVVLLTDVEDSRDLVAVGTVDTDEVIGVAVVLSVGHDLGEVAVDIVLRLAVTAVGVRRVDDTIALGTATVGCGGRRSGGLGGGSSRAVSSGRRESRGLGGGGSLGAGSLVDRGESGGAGGDVDLSGGRGSLRVGGLSSGLGVDGGNGSNDGGSSRGCRGLALSRSGVRSAVLVNEDDNVGKLGGHVGVVGLVDNLLTLLVKLLVTAWDIVRVVVPLDRLQLINLRW